MFGSPRLRQLILRCNGIDGTRSKVSDSGGEGSTMASIAGISLAKLERGLEPLALAAGSRRFCVSTPAVQMADEAAK